MTSKTGDELRALAAAIERITEESRVGSVALRIVRNCTDHLTAVARIHDFNAPSVRHD